MSTKDSPHRIKLTVAAATGLGYSTVHRYYVGKPVTPANSMLIERACVELGYPLRGEVKRKAARRG